MNRILFILLFSLPAWVWSQESDHFSRYFTNLTLRIDYYHSGDAKSEMITIDKIFAQGTWAGNPENCIQPFELGTYKVNVYDSASRKLIFSKGYNSIFAEYQTIDPALKGIQRTYQESALIPCPLKPFVLVFEKRDRYNKLSEIFKQTINPSDFHIIREAVNDNQYKTIPVVARGNPHTSVDLVILAEGYQNEEQDTFSNDLKYFTELLFTVEPFKSNKEKFNVHGIFSPSKESGTDEPRQGIYKNTILNSSFNTFDTDRYCLADDNKEIRDMAAGVPYDIILIMINSNRYGGGGIYNWQTVFTNRSLWRDYVFLHEFGHGFAGLADEYFTSSVAYLDINTPGVEPLEANITASTDPDKVKWKEYLSPGIAIPTDWGKSTFDSLELRKDELYAKMEASLTALKKTGAKESELERTANEFNSNIFQVQLEQNNFIKNHPLKDKVGVFEGANYMSKGMYRPTLNSLMHKFDEDNLSYGPVNEHAIHNTIRYYTGE
jgi:hypothetical protein